MNAAAQAKAQTTKRIKREARERVTKITRCACPLCFGDVIDWLEENDILNDYLKECDPHD